MPDGPQERREEEWPDERLYEGEPLIRLDELSWRGGGILSKPRKRPATPGEPYDR